MTPRTASRCAVLFTLLIFLAALAPAALAAPPATISYQGELRDAQGQPVTGTVDMVLAIFDSAEGPNSLWSDLMEVQVTDGVFSVVLGSQTPLDLPFDQPYWLGIFVNTDPEMTPRKALTSVPYSMRSLASDRAEAVAWSQVTGKPTILGPYANKIMVAKSGGQFTSIQAACDSITDASEDNPYLIVVGPGLYQEQVTTPAHVSVQGSGRGVTMVKTTSDTYVWCAGDHCRLSDLTLINHRALGYLCIGIYLPDGKTLHLSRVDIELNYGGYSEARGVHTGGQSHLVASQVSIVNTGVKGSAGMYILGGLHADRVSISGAGEGFIYGLFRSYDSNDEFLVENSHIVGKSCSIMLANGSSPTQVRNSRLEGDIYVSSYCTMRISVSELDGEASKDSGATLSCYGCFDSNYNELGADCQ